MKPWKVIGEEKRRPQECARGLIFQDPGYGQRAFGKYGEGRGFRLEGVVFVSEEKSSRGWTDLEDELGVVGEMDCEQGI